MNLQPYVEDLQRQLAVAADAGGDELRALGERLIAPFDAAIQLALLDVLGAAAEEITCDLAPGSVELRLRGREPEFVVTPPPADERAMSDRPAARLGPPAAADGDEGAMARINVRMPDHVKTRIERAAADEGLSVNAWLVRAATAALDRGEPDRRGEGRPTIGRQRYTGWAR